MQYFFYRENGRAGSGCFNMFAVRSNVQLFEDGGGDRLSVDRDKDVRYRDQGVEVVKRYTGRFRFRVVCEDPLVCDYYQDLYAGDR